MENDTNWGTFRTPAGEEAVWYNVGKATPDEIELAKAKAQALSAARTDTKPSNPKDLIGSNKVPMSLVPGTTMAYLALGHMEGDLKYGRSNWREAGVRALIYLDALYRHVEKYKAGEWEDPDTTVPHLANALTCLSIIVDAHECGKLIDDRPKQAPVASMIDRFGEKVKFLREKFKASRPVDYLFTGPKQREE